MTVLTHDERAEKFARVEVYCNASTLVSELLKLDEHMDELLQICTRPVTDDEWIEAARNAGATFKDNGAEYAWVHEGEEGHDFTTVAEAAEDFCELQGIHVEGAEVFEHYIVSDWLADQLERSSEAVLHDFMGLNIWGRTVTGQNMTMDGTFQAIAKRCDVELAAYRAPASV